MGTDVFMICVAANNQDSFTNIKKWQDEITVSIQNVPMALILTKKDLSDDIDEPVTLVMLKEK